jgi:hypothetical protein
MFEDGDRMPEVATDAFVLTGLPSRWDTAVSTCGEPKASVTPWYSPVNKLRPGDGGDARTCYLRLREVFGLAPAYLPHIPLTRGARACVYPSVGAVALLTILATPTDSRPTFEASVTLWVSANG